MSALDVDERTGHGAAMWVDSIVDELVYCTPADVPRATSREGTEP